MRITAHSLHPYRLRYRRTVAWSDVSEEAAIFVMLRLRDEDGRDGVGEVAIKPTWVGASVRSLTAVIEDMFAPLLCAEFSHPAELRERLDRIPENLVAKTLIDHACWDLHAAREAIPISIPDIPVSWALTRQAPSLMAQEAVRMRDAYGFRTLKVKGGQGMDVDRAALREIRAALGDGTRLYVDANGAYAPAEAETYVKMLADAGVFAAEDPCPLTPDRRFRALQEASPIPLLVDFNCTSPRDAALFKDQGLQALSVKPGRFGMTWARKMAQDGAPNGVAIAVGLMGESIAGTLPGLQFASTVSSSEWPAELTWFLEMQDSVTRVALEIADGRIAIPHFKTVAETIDWDAVRKFAI
ncbi:enolase C-terminal domain-like protein [Roseiarcaceae bacterium H3SJ34-1]|uniref:mandelate racemase/muconate lactonizing enzyme family protein n=1 Tax=Terripilifer ovatus TaxID=3032367 RepID=UPI003AB99B2B|nr:enolase C-terminal domain-like protein [Roseiarcaceae bacterium H3SJ34-1]